MQEQEYFKNALSNFTYEAASGGAIRHLTDLGYTVKQIMKQLDFPTPYTKVQKIVWEHLLETEILILTEPESRKKREKAVFVKDYDKYGKTSLRLAVQKEKNSAPLILNERYLTEIENNGLSAFLKEKCAKNGEASSYVSCDFGLRLLNSPSNFKQSLQALDIHQQDYILGLPWAEKICYHRLTDLMRETIVRLYENGDYHGSFHFLKTEEKIIF